MVRHHTCQAAFSLAEAVTPELNGRPNSSVPDENVRDAKPHDRRKSGGLEDLTGRMKTSARRWRRKSGGLGAPNLADGVTDKLTFGAENIRPRLPAKGGNGRPKTSGADENIRAAKTPGVPLARPLSFFCGPWQVTSPELMQKRVRKAWYALSGRARPARLSTCH